MPAEMKTAPSAKPSARLWLASLGFLLAIAALRVWLGVSADGFGPADDLDDLLRQVQVRQWLDGRDWFDVSQPRMGLDAGTDMHWSRLVDLPMAGLTLLLSPFMERAAALDVATTLWPPALGSVFIGLLMVLGWARGRLAGLLIAAVAGAGAMTYLAAFNPGRIDHHNWQILCIAGAVVALVIAEERVGFRARHGAVAGAMLGLSLAIGPEAIALVSVICTFVALRWAFGDAVALRRMTTAFGASLALSVALCLVLTIPPSDYGVARCDQISVAHLVAAVAGGGGLAAAARMAASCPMAIRLASLVGLGLLCAVALALAAPECLGNPLNALPTDVRAFWLDHVQETQPFTKRNGSSILLNSTVGFGTVLFATLLLMLDLRRRPSPAHALLFALLVLAAAFSAYQIRYNGLLQALSVVSVVYALSGSWAARRASPRVALPMLGAAAINPFVLLVAVVVVTGASSVREARPDCDTDRVLGVLAAQPTGRVLSEPNLAPPLLANTPHSAVSSNYHRNIEGLTRQIDIFLAEPEEAVAMMRDSKVDYLVSCRGFAPQYAEASPEGLHAAIAAGTVPDGLELLDDGPSHVFAVKP